MILAIDIGNTSITLAILKGKRVIKKYSIISLELHKVLAPKVNVFLKTIKRTFPKIEDVVICSVVPKHLKMIESAIKRILQKKSIVIGRDLKVPIKNNYSKPSHVGEDRLVGAYAAKILYGQPLIIIDFGTAITFDIINVKGHYDGGIIVPGIRLSAESLFKKTALLPRIDTFKAPRSIIGKDTKESILSGIYYGYGALANGLITQLQRILKNKAKVILTGGHAVSIKRFISKKNLYVQEQLVFKGIYFILQRTK